MRADKSPFLDCAGCLCLASRKAARGITRIYDRELRPHRLRSTQFSLLAMLELKAAQPVGALARALGTERTTLTRNLALIERQGLVETRAGDDARERIVVITPAGRRALEKALPAWRRAQAELTRSIGPQLADNLRRLARASGL